MGRLEIELHELGMECQDEHDKFVEAEKLRKRTATALARTTIADGYRHDDEFFKRGVRELRYAIKNWVTGQSWHVCDRATTLPSWITNRSNYISNASPYFEKYIISQGGIVLILQAIIWNFLSEHVFGKDLWRGAHESLGVDDDTDQFNFAKAHEILKNLLNGKPSILEYQSQLIIHILGVDSGLTEEDRVKYHEWRALTARILEPKIDIARLRQTIKWTNDKLIGLLSPIATTVFDTDELRNIMVKSVDLDAAMSKQKADFQFLLNNNYDNRGRLSYDTRYMQDSRVDGHAYIATDNKCVTLVVAPGLIKYGSSEGRDYGSAVTVVRMEVDTKPR